MTVLQIDNLPYKRTLLPPPTAQGPVSIYRPSYLRMAISMLKIRRPLERLIFNMGIAIPGTTVFLIETAPWFWHHSPLFWLSVSLSIRLYVFLLTASRGSLFHYRIIFNKPIHKCDLYHYVPLSNRICVHIKIYTNLTHQNDISFLLMHYQRFIYLFNQYYVPDWYIY